MGQVRSPKSDLGFACDHKIFGLSSVLYSVFIRFTIPGYRRVVWRAGRGERGCRGSLSLSISVDR